MAYVVAPQRIWSRGQPDFRPVSESCIPTFCTIRMSTNNGLVCTYRADFSVAAVDYGSGSGVEEQATRDLCEIRARKFHR